MAAKKHLALCVDIKFVSVSLRPFFLRPPQFYHGIVVIPVVLSLFPAYFVSTSMKDKPPLESSEADPSKVRRPAPNLSAAHNNMFSASFSIIFRLPLAVGLAREALLLNKEACCYLSRVPSLKPPTFVPASSIHYNKIHDMICI